MKQKCDLSIVIPTFQAEETVNILLDRLTKTIDATDLAYEIILVDDGSRDETWNLIKEKTCEYHFLKGIRLSRNFGQHNAISAGLTYVKGKRVVVMDCDLQDMPEEIPKLYDKALEGYEVVVAQRINRSDNKIKIWRSRMFFSLFEKLTGLKFEKGIGNFGIYSAKVVQSVLLYQESFRPFPIIVGTIGYKRVAVEVRHAKRMKGRSNYNGLNLFKGAVNSILYYSHKPIWFFLIGGLGIVASLLFLIAAALFVTFSISVVDLMVILILLMSFVSINTAMIGIYVSRLFIEVKKRPSYIIDELA